MRLISGIIYVVAGLSEEAIDYFGVTFNPKEAGYIMKDGTLLDFSGRYGAKDYEKSSLGTFKTKDGMWDYLRGTRNIDHRQIGEIYKGRGADDWGKMSKNMRDFMKKTGAIRFKPEIPGADIRVKPTMTQVRTLVRMLNDISGKGFCEIDFVGDMGAIDSKEYYGITVEELMTDLGGYF